METSSTPAYAQWEQHSSSPPSPSAREEDEGEAERRPVVKRTQAVPGSCGEHVRESCSFDGDVKYSSLCSVRAAFFVATFAKCARRRRSRASSCNGADASCTRTAETSARFCHGDSSSSAYAQGEQYSSSAPSSVREKKMKVKSSVLLLKERTQAVPELRRPRHPQGPGPSVEISRSPTHAQGEQHSSSTFSASASDEDGGQAERRSVKERTQAVPDPRRPRHPRDRGPPMERQVLQFMLKKSSILRRHLRQVREKKIKPSVPPWWSDRKLYRSYEERRDRKTHHQNGGKATRSTWRPRSPSASRRRCRAKFPSSGRLRWKCRCTHRAFVEGQV